jgi:hypothetical protein
VTFYGNTSQAIIIFMPQNGCLRVLDAARGDTDIYHKESRFLTDAIPLSDVSNIVTETDSPASAEMFFPESKHEWCYYFAKAELAQQQGDYQTVVTLGDEAASLGYAPEDQREWLLFIEAYALTGNMQTAQNLSTTVLRSEPAIKRGLCTVWEQIKAEHELEASQMTKELGCGK